MMNRARQLRVPGLVTLLLVAVLLLVSAAQAAPPTPASRYPTAPKPTDALAYQAASADATQLQSADPKLDSSLTAIASAAKTSRAAGAEAARSQHLSTSADAVQVYVTASPGQTAVATAAVESAGGRVTKSADEAGLVQAWIPVDKLGQVAADASVALVSRPDYAVSDAGAYTTQGLALSGGYDWHAAGYRGAGAKVAIIDQGFIGYSGLLGTDLPASVTVKNFVDGETDAQMSAVTEHGTACAEIVHDMAPDAQMYLVKVSTSLDLQEAVNWLGTERIDVISMGLGWLNVGPGDGTGFVASMVSQARSLGITWVNSGGIYRQQHWGGTFRPDAYGYHLWSSDNHNVNAFGPGNGQWYLIPAGEFIEAYLRWNDWTNVTQNYNFMLVRWNNATHVWQQVVYSNTVQSGQLGQRPTEYLEYTTTGDTTFYGIVAEKIGANTSANLELITPGWELDYQVAARSISSPADSPYAIGVGAVDVVSPTNQEPYSSEGPSNGPGGSAAGGLVKPDMVGYANVTLATYTMWGTSPAAAHVAGAAALVAGLYPSYTPDQISAFLTGRAIHLGTAGKNNQYGYGRLYLGDPPPKITDFSPTTGLPGSTVTITGQLFTGATAVAFNGVAAPFTVDWSTQIRATVPSGVTTGPISVTTPSGTALSPTSFVVPIQISIGDVQVTEGNAGTKSFVFSVSLSESSAQAVAVSYLTDSGTASPGSDYQSVSGTLAFAPGETSKQISVPVIGDTAYEQIETFYVKLSDPANAVIADGQGLGKILNDDAAPPAPTITGFSPTSGTTGTSVTIYGTNLAGATAVSFNGTSAAILDNSSTQISTVVPAGTPGGPISVTTPGGTATSPGSFTLTALTQSMTDVEANLIGVSWGSVAWGDYDADGDLDILLAGNDSSTGNPVSKVYRNDGGTFADVGANLVGVASGSTDWGDYDADGDLDVLLTGGVSKVYRNDSGVFTDIHASLVAVGYSSADWGDYDNDGDLDILLTGQDNLGARNSKVYRNDGGTFADVGANLVGVVDGSAVWGDYDADGDLDIALTGQSGLSEYASKVYRNDGGLFADIGASLVPAHASSVAWGDYDNDGDLDILLEGYITNVIVPGAFVTKVYRNDYGTFVDLGSSLADLDVRSVAWGDLDNDGDLDILLTGSGSGSSKVLRNHGNGVFTEAVTNLVDVASGNAAWGDYDNDGDLDVLIAGRYGWGSLTRVYRNDGLSTNLSPTAPTGLSSPAIGKRVNLAWSASSDSRTPAPGLTYNLRVGTTPGGSDVMPPMALGTGYRQVPALGNANHNLSWTLENLPPGTYYWSVQAVDTSFAGSPFAQEQSFTIACNPLTLGHSGNGGDPAASPTNSVGCPAGQYLAGEQIALTALADSGYRVSGWTGTNDDSSRAPTNTLSMPASARTVSVAYSQGVAPQVSFLPQPVRIVDTRLGSGYQGAGQSIPPNPSFRRFTLAGNGGIPANATAVLVNLTAVGYRANGWLAAYPACTAWPGTSSLNFDTDENAIANYAVIKLGIASADPTCQGAIDVTASSSTNAIVDAVGYLVSTSDDQIALLSTPARLVDTRPGSGKQGAGQPIPTSPSSRRFTLGGNGGIPSNATAVLVNLTAVGYTRDGWVAAWPACTTWPGTSNLNFDTDEYAIANFAIVKLGSGPGCQGAIDVTGAASTNFIVDVVGYLVATPTDHIALLTSPQRIVDSRPALPYQGSGLPLPGNGAPRCYQLAGQGGVPIDAQGVILNLTAVGYRGDGWIAAYPYGQALPSTSSVNYDTQENAIANTAVVRLGTEGQICLVSSSITNAIVDVSGYLR